MSGLIPLTFACAGFAVAVGVAVIAGWVHDIDVLKSVIPGFVAMKANTAIAFALAGASLLLLAPASTTPRRRRVGQALALTVVLVGSLTLGEEIFGWELGIDQLLIEDHDTARVLTSAPGRMAVSSAIAFLAFGLALVSIDWKPWRGYRPCDFLVGLVLALSALAALEYVFGRVIAHPFLSSTRMAVHTFVTFFVLSAGLLAARPGQGMVGAIRGRMESALERRVYVSLALSLVALMVTGGAVFFAAQDSVKRSGMVGHTQEVRRQLARLLSTHQDLQLGGRGYAITGKASFLEPFEEADKKADGVFKTLATMVRDNPTQSNRVRQIDILRRQHIVWSAAVVAARQSGGASVATSLIASGGGKSLTDELRNVIEQMDAEEARLLRERMDEERTSIMRLNWTLATSTLFALLVVGFAGVVIHRDFGRRQRAEQTVREQNEMLEKRVRDRTAQLSESEARLEATVENLSEGVVVSGVSGAILQFNRAAMKMHGFAEPDEYRRMLPEFANIFELSAADGSILPLDEWPLARVLRGETLHDLEVGIRRLGNGWRRIFSYGGVLARDPAGKPFMAVLTINDITERKNAEVRLRENEERFRLLIEGVKDYAIIMLNPQGRVATWNEGARLLKGYEEAEIVGQPMSRFHTPEDEAAGQPSQLLARAVAEGRVEDFGERMHKNGTRFYADVVLTAMHNAAGELVGFTKITRDVTERRRAESKIRAQLEHLNLLDHITRATGERQDLKSIFQVVVRSLEDSLPIDFGCVCLRDPATNALTVTSVGVKSVALAHELTLDADTSIDVDTNGLLRCLQGQLVYEPDIGQSLFPFPQRLARGGLRSLVMAPLNSESRVFGVLVVARRAAEAFDSVECEFLRQLSEHVALAAHQAQLYGSLQQAYDDLRRTQQAAMQEERLRALGQMASGIAHDINNALSPVSLYTESLLETEKNLSGRARGYLETIQRAVEDVAHTVARMREFYRQREHQIELAPLDANQMVQQVVDLTEARWSDQPMQSGIVISPVIDLAPDLPKVMGVESEIREALTNLVFNAVDAMPLGGTLTLRTRLAGTKPDRSVIVEVTDTGIGMHEDTRKRCLEPFFTTKGERGTGLGLAMVYGMVQRHSCGIEIDSALGEGTTMRLVFAVPTAVIAEDGRPAAAPEAPRRLRLLLVDDDPVLQASLRDALETDSHIIVTANGGQAGIDTFRAAQERDEPFAAVITDLGMPYVDGRKVAAAVKEASPVTPVILLTGWGQRLIADGETPPDVDRVIAKPPKLRELRQALAQLCALKSPAPTV